MKIKTNPFFTITVAIFNLEKEIIPFLKSLFNQSFKNFEIFLIDDCSTDQTKELIKFFLRSQNSDVAVYFLKNYENQGLGFVRRKALSQINGQYLIQLDGDDVLYPNYLQLIYEIIQQHNPDIIFGKYTENPLFTPTDDLITNYEVYENFQNFRDINLFVPKGIWRHAVRSELAIKVYEELNHKIIDLGEDMVFLSSAYHKSSKIIYLNKEILYYRRRFESYTDYSNLNKSKVENFFDAHLFVNDAWRHYPLPQSFFNILTAAFKVKFIKYALPFVDSSEMQKPLEEIQSIYQQIIKNPILIQIVKKSLDNQDFGFFPNIKILTENSW